MNMFIKDGKDGMHYEYFLTKVLKHFEIPLEHGDRGNVKKLYLWTLLLSVEILKGRKGTSVRCLNYWLNMTTQLWVKYIVVTLANRNVEISCMDVKVQLAKTEGSGEEELASLNVHNDFMATKMYSSMSYFSGIYAEVDARLSLLFQTPSYKPLPPKFEYIPSFELCRYYPWSFL